MVTVGMRAIHSGGVGLSEPGRMGESYRRELWGEPSCWHSEHKDRHAAKFSLQERGRARSRSDFFLS